jgi:competence protein ComEC
VAGLLCAGARGVGLAGVVLGLVLVLALGARGHPAAGLALAATAMVLAGAVLGAARLAALDRTSLGPLLGRTVSIHATLLERPRPARPRNGMRAATAEAALVQIVSGTGRGERVVLRAARWPRVRVGAELAAAGRLLQLGRRDGWQRRRGAHARLLATRVVATGRARGGLAGAVDRLRKRAERAVSAGLDPPRAALARGMVLGEDEALSDSMRPDFRASGLAHLVAASGQNVALLAALAIPLLAALGFGLRGRLAGALALVALYVPLAGGGPSIQRAGIMGGAGLVAALAGRRTSRAYALLLAAAATLALNPRAAADPGWQLSFAAVVAIAALSRPVSRRLTERGLPGPVAEAASLTTAATLATAPLLAAHFGRLSLVSLPANLLAAAAVAPTMWLGMLAVAVAFVLPGAAVLIHALAQYPLAYLGWLGAAAAHVPFASVNASPPAVTAGAALATAALAAWARGPARDGPLRPRRGWASAWAAWLRRPGRRAAVVVVAVATALLLAPALPGCGSGPAAPDPRDLVVSFLDVGQGDATLIQHGAAAILVDTGPPGGPILQRLDQAGVRRLDLFVVTHAQTDHEGEAAAVLDRYPVGAFLDGGDPSASGSGTLAPAWAYAARLARAGIVAAAARHHVRRLVPDAGKVLRAGPLELDVLWPRREPPARHAGLDPNQRAIVAHLRDGEFDLLLPADAESDVTAPLPLPPVEALKVAHHGSAAPGTADLLARLRPRVVVIEVGRHNPYGHPTAQALGALRAAVPAVYRTDRDGTVRLVVREGRMTVTTAR